jgi:hypothetical protein
MPTAKTVTVYPVAGLYITGVPAVETTTEADVAEALVSTGAFSYAAPPPEPPPDAADNPGDAQATPDSEV